MPLRSALLLVTLVLVARPLQSGWLFGPKVTVEILQGKQGCYDVGVPKCWYIAELQDCIDPYEDGSLRAGPATALEFRESEADPSRLLVGAFKTVVEYRDSGRSVNLRRYSLQHYAISLVKNPELRPTPQAEWDAANPLPRFASPIPDRPLYSRPSDDQPLTFQGRAFTKSGRFWDVTHEYASTLSGDLHYLSVHSWDGDDDPGEGIGPWRRTGKVAGRYWLDLFEVSTARRIAVLSGSFRAYRPVSIFSATHWLGKRYFVAPIGGGLQRFVICDVTKLSGVK